MLKACALALSMSEEQVSAMTEKEATAHRALREHPEFADVRTQ